MVGKFIVYRFVFKCRTKLLFIPMVQHQATQAQEVTALCFWQAAIEKNFPKDTD